MIETFDQGEEFYELFPGNFASERWWGRKLSKKRLNEYLEYERVINSFWCAVHRKFEKGWVILERKKLQKMGGILVKF
jgi:hypothetical protein